VAPKTEQHDGTGRRSRTASAGDGHGRTAESPGQIPAKGWKDIAKRVWAEMKENHTQLLAAGVAFWAFTSIFPALIAAISIYGLVVEPEEVAARVEDLASALPAEAQTLLTEQLEGLTSTSGSALGIGLIFSILTALWAASAGMSNLMDAINAVYEESDDRKFPKKKGLAVLLTVAAIAFLGLAIAAIAAVPAILEAIGVGGAAKALLSLAVWPFLGVGFVLGLSILYRFAPDRDDAEWRWVTPGAVTAMVVWVAASLAFQFYTANLGSYQKTYGALAAVVIMLLWLMISCLCVLLGAHVNAELEAQTAHDTTVDDERPMGQRGAYKADNLGEIAEGRGGTRDGERDSTSNPDTNQIDLREEHVR
jgi:membrane protein